VRLSEVVNRDERSTTRGRSRRRTGSASEKNLTQIVRDATNEARQKHFELLDWSRSRAFLSKSRYMSGRQCPKKLWYAVYDPEPPEEPLAGTAKGMGIEVGIKARLLWPGGILVDDPDRPYFYDAGVRRTKTLIADPTVPAIMEATLVHDGVLVRVDALERLPDGRWRVNEIKSSTRIKDHHLEDLALQIYVLAGNGLELADAYLVFINNEYVRGEEVDWDAAFVRQDVTDDVIRLLPKVPERIAEMHKVLCSTEPPEISPSRHCFNPYECEFWQRCTADKPKDWIFHLPRISASKLEELERLGVVSMRDIPDDFPLKPMQRRVVDAAKSGKIHRSPELAKMLPLLTPPVSYLDFETFSPAIPLYPNTSPYQRIPFQWSWDYDDGSGVLAHRDFLADGDNDPRREFCETLLSVSERFSGAVMAWSNYEISVIRDMAELFPDLAERLIAVSYRIIDLLRIVQDHVAHPEFFGSYSMKHVAPAIAHELTYEGLDIADGGEASASFYRMVTDPTLSPAVREGIRESLLEYCARDTLALARVHQWLIRLS
jgi:CRISPR/Cas system-associated exonuclease Cas4 (RecB family)